MADDASKWHVSQKELADTGIGRKRWNEMNKNERIRHTITVFVKLVFLVFFIFGFIFILSLLGVAFRLIGGKGLGSAIRHSSFLHNPIAASIIGMVISMVIQNTTTFMSVLVSMVAGRLLTVHEALPFMIGTEIGGSVLNVLVSMAQSGNSDQFRRAFATAVMNDVFNLLNYVVLLPTEMAFGLIEKTSGFLVRPLSHTRTVKVRTLEAFTSPLIQLVVQIDNDAITKIAAMSGNKTAIALLDRPTFIHRCVNMTNGETVEDCSYFHLFAYSTWSDVTIGILLLIISIGTLLGCLVGIVRIMKSLLAGSVAVFVRRVLDHDCPYPFRFLTGYLIMLIGGLIVAIIQSSNVFRSSLIPLAGIGVISLDRIYPLFVGANIGTTSTATLAALSADPSQLQETMQMALCQTLYNLFGMLLFYPIPFMRQIPITIAMKLGNITAKHRWFSICYTLFVFFLIPCFLIALSLMPDFIMYTVLGIITTFIAAIILINWFQISYPNYLPEWLKDWNFLPVWLHSLTFYDQHAHWIGQKFPCCPRRFFTSTESNDSISMSDVSRP